MSQAVLHTTTQKAAPVQTRPQTSQRNSTYPADTIHSLLRLQQAVGNQSVIQLLGASARGTGRPAPVQRCGACAANAGPAEEECPSCRRKRQAALQRSPDAGAARLQRETGENRSLRSPRFAGDVVLEACLNGRERLTAGRTGDAVKRIQQALIDVAKLESEPDPLPAFGVDAKFGSETAEAIHKFKQKRGISPSDGVVGQKTMTALDALFSHEPKPQPKPDPKPQPKPDPKPQPEPSSPHEGCTAATNATIDSAHVSALSALDGAIGALSERPFSPHTQDALWLALRATTAGDAATIIDRLQKVRRALPSAKIVCSDPDPIGLFCADGVNAQGNIITKTIHVCNKFWNAAGNTQRTRALIHEGLHVFAGVTGFGEKSHGADCDESDVAGQSRAFRMQNADSLACVVILLTDPSQKSLSSRVRHSKGGDLVLRQQPKGDINLRAAPQSTKFEMQGFADVGIQGARWIFRDRDGRKYLLLADGGNTIVSPDTETPFIGGLFLGAKTRALLQKRLVTEAELTAISTIPEVGQKTVGLTVRLVP